MRRILLTLSLFSLILLAVGSTYSPNDPIFWLAAGGTAIQCLRAGLSLILLAQLFTRPPRHVIFRILAGIVAASTGFWAIQMTYSGHIMLLDSLSLTAAAIAIGVTALELRPEDKLATYHLPKAT